VRAENTGTIAAGPQPSIPSNTETPSRTRSNTPATTQNNTPARTTNAPKQEPLRQNPPKAQPNTGKIVYKVQFATFPQDIPVSDKRFRNVQQPDKYFHNGLYKYTSGSFFNYREAVNHQNQLRKAGYADAFVVAFLNGQRITINEAQKSARP
jgi:N-acetylmuramoyl-L-alanine amidase